MLHMHQLRDFLDDRNSFYEKFYLGKNPRHYSFKGVEKAFTMGSAIDFAIKTYYTNGKKNEGLLNSNEFKSLANRIDQTIVMALVDGYIDYYGEDEYFHDFKVQNWPIKYKNYVVYTSPDLTAEMYNSHDLVIIEIKTSFDEDHITETLDFQTMCYAWASYRWNFKIPVGVLKRNIVKPKIKQKAKEDVLEFQKRIIFDITDNPDKYYKSNFRPVTKEMILEFEKYLHEIIHEIDLCFKSCNRYKFYKKSTEYWGM